MQEVSWLNKKCYDLQLTNQNLFDSTNQMAETAMILR